MAKITALIPARSGSKGVADKNIRKLSGYPLLAYSIEACLQSERIEEVIVSTDSEDYAEMARAWGARAPFLRPDAISGDDSGDYDFIAHALDWLAEHETEPEYIVHIRPTSPLRDPKKVDEAIDVFCAAKEATALRSVEEMSESAYKALEINDGGLLTPLGGGEGNLDNANKARQQYPATFYPNGYVDVLKVSFIRENGMIHGDRVMPYVTENIVEVDTLSDFEMLEWSVERKASPLLEALKQKGDT